MGRVRQEGDGKRLSQLIKERLPIDWPGQRESHVKCEECGSPMIQEEAQKRGTDTVCMECSLFLHVVRLQKGASPMDDSRVYR